MLPIIYHGVQSSRRALTEPESRSKASPAPQASPDPPKQRHMCAERFLYLQRLELLSITNTKRNRETKGEGCQETPDRSQDNTRCPVLRKTTPKRLLHLYVEQKGAQRHRQGHQPTGIPVPSEKQDSGSTKKKKLKETLDSITIFSSYGNNLS